ncbi:MAG: DUF2818 family protein [Azoarcus sp.]|jgi:hypothetical protein|nr:DUF2818 family protein [Azoarcus sp.]
MAGEAAAWVVLGLAFVGANLPFLFERVLFIRAAPGGKKALGWRLVELALLYFVIGAAAAVLEKGAYGMVYPQGWEFYAITVCLFLVFAFPGFVWRYLWVEHRKGKAE